MKSIAILSALVVAALAGQIDVPPSHTAAVVGSNVNLTCQASGDLSQYRLAWKEHISSATGALIFNSAMSGPNDEEDYGIHGHYDLMIKEANIQDGGVYSCALDDQPTPHNAYVFIFERPHLLVPKLRVGETHQFECRVDYGAPPQAILTPANYPQMKARIDMDEITNGKEMLRTSGLQGEQSQLVYAYNVTIDDEFFHLKTFSCEVTLEDPEYKIGDRKILHVDHPATSISDITPERSSFYVGEYIQCGANGYPDPNYQWDGVDTPIDPEPTIDGNQLKITEAMIGRNTWKCQASNDINDANGIDKPTKEVTFNVLAATAPPYSSATAIQASVLVMFLVSLLAKLM